MPRILLAAVLLGASSTPRLWAGGLEAAKQESGLRFGEGLALEKEERPSVNARRGTSEGSVAALQAARSPRARLAPPVPGKASKAYVGRNYYEEEAQRRADRETAAFAVNFFGPILAGTIIGAAAGGVGGAILGGVFGTIIGIFAGMFASLMA